MVSALVRWAAPRGVWNEAMAGIPRASYLRCKKGADLLTCVKIYLPPESCGRDVTAFLESFMFRPSYVVGTFGLWACRDRHAGLRRSGQVWLWPVLPPTGRRRRRAGWSVPGPPVQPAGTLR